MSQIGKFSSLNAPIETLTTDDAVVVAPVAGNINLAGGTNINTTGAGNTATVNLDNSISLSGTIDAVGDITSSAGDIEATLGNLLAPAGFLNVGLTVTAAGNITSSGGDIISTVGAGSFATSVTVGNALHVLSGGVDIVGTIEFSDLTTGTLRTNATGIVSSLADGTDGQVLISSTAGTPIWATLTAGTGIVIVNAANSITISSTAVNSVTGGTNINITGTATDPIVNLDDPITLTTVNATTFDTNVATAAVTLSGTTLAADGTDANIDINITPKGTGVLASTELTLTTDLAVQYGGTGVSTFTQYGILVGNAATDIQALAVGGTDTVLLGNTAANPSWGTVGNAALTNSSVTLSNGANITVTGSPLSLGGTATIALSGTTDHTIQVGNATGSLTSLAVGTTNQVLLGNTGADPSWGSVDLSTDITGTLPVGNGGTGATTLTDNGLLYGNGTSAVAALAEATNGQIPIGSTGNPPILSTLTEGTNIDVTNAAGSITVETTKVEINAQTGTSYTLVLGDRGKLVTMTNAAASTFTVPPNSSVAFSTGTVITVAQLGAGQVTLTEGSGVTINSVGSNKKIKDQYAAIALHKTGTDTWLAVGSLEA